MSDGELEGEPAAALQQALDVIRSGKISLVINIPEGSSKAGVVSNGYQIRRCTCDYGVSLITNVKVAKLFVEAMAVRSNIVSFPLIALLPRCALSLSVCLSAAGTAGCWLAYAAPRRSPENCSEGHPGIL